MLSGTLRAGILNSRTVHRGHAPTNKITDDAVIKERVIAINDKDLEGIAAHIETGKMLIELEDEIDHGKWRPLFKGYKGDQPGGSAVSFR